MGCFHLDHVGRSEFTISLYYFHLALLREPGQPLGKFVDNGFFPRTELAEFYGGFAESNPLSLRFFRFGNDLRHMQQRLGRNAADIEAYATQRGVALDQYHLLAEIGGAERGGVATRPRAQYHYIGMNIATWSGRNGAALNRR